MKFPCPELEREVREVVLWLIADGTTIASRQRIEEIIIEFPFWCPNVATLDKSYRQKVISYYLNKKFTPLNQTGKRPRSKAWVLASTGGVSCPA